MVLGPWKKLLWRLFRKTPLLFTIISALAFDINKEQNTFIQAHV